MTALAVFASVCIVDEFAKIFKDFGTDLPAMTTLVDQGSRGR